MAHHIKKYNVIKNKDEDVAEAADAAEDVVEDAANTANESADESFRARLGTAINGSAFTKFITTLIVLNAITLGLETSKTVMNAVGPLVYALDKGILVVFVLELLSRLYVERWKFWKNGWNIFDFVVVAIALVPSSGPFAILRAFRVLRVLRLVSTVPSMRRVVEGLFKAIPGMSAITLLMCLIVYVSAVMTTVLFGEQFPDWFGNIGRSAFSLFQIMTLEGWSDGIVRPIMEKFPWAWAFFVPFILVTAFAVLNLFVGIIVDGMQQEHTAEIQEATQEAVEQTEDELQQIIKEIQSLREEVRSLKSDR